MVGKQLHASAGGTGPRGRYPELGRCRLQSGACVVAQAPEEGRYGVSATDRRGVARKDLQVQVRPGSQYVVVTGHVSSAADLDTWRDTRRSASSTETPV